MTDKVLDKCPKCSSVVTNDTECENCGIVFEKYFQVEARKKAEAAMITVESAGSGNRRVVLLACVFLIISFGAGYFFLSQPNTQISSAPTAVNIPVNTSKIRKVEKNYSRPLPVMTAETPDETLSDQELIQRAVRGTVSVRTPWGSIGSGFFIEEHSVITNKHVVVFDDTRFETLQKQVERNREIIDLEIEKISEWKKKMEQMPQGPSRSQLELIIRSKEEELDRVLVLQRDDEEKLDELIDQKYAEGVRITTADNEEYLVDTIVTSTAHDLALLKVYSISGHVLGRDAQEQRLEQGQAVYAIGSPMGLSNTMTSGIFSAYRRIEDGGEIYLQVDAAINPGNSGGPLIDKRGNVLGVNTMVLTQAEGIGFAIPIDVVFEEFSGSL
ncbi:MAG TPA: S1C family serine protease [Deltaproteobacteria bacterium]|nr:S1C family serine protease [Deltaproteobacteria bacterium]